MKTLAIIRDAVTPVYLAQALEGHMRGSPEASTLLIS